jgi:hypothetical protein
VPWCSSTSTHHKITDPLIRADVEVLLLTGKAMHLAARLIGHRRLLAFTHESVVRYAKYAAWASMSRTSGHLCVASLRLPDHRRTS